MKQRLKSALLGILLAVAPVACKGFLFPEKELVFDIPKIEAVDYEDLFKKMANRIAYKTDREIYDVEHYFATPEEVENNKAGDCEDVSFSDVYQAYRDFGIEGYVINGGLPGIGYFHYWIEIDGKEYESKTGERQNFDTITMRRKFSYDQVMEMFRDRE
ncbi:MAG: hypothetical protein Q7S06_00030 [Nanoarchaeota archaeon]|nr:hypothetical protein [Nanoarchaeota archaeon]